MGSARRKKKSRVIHLLLPLNFQILHCRVARVRGGEKMRQVMSNEIQMTCSSASPAKNLNNCRINAFHGVTSSSCGCFGRCT
jgi:hypothetical protein